MAKVLLVLGYPDIFSAGDHVPEVIASGPVALEAIDSRFVGNLKTKGLHRAEIAMLPEGGGWLIVEFGGDDRQEASERARRLVEALKGKSDAPAMQLFEDPREQEMIWTVRESGLGADAHVPGEEENHEGWEDSAVPPDQLGAYLRDLRALIQRYGYVGSLYGHFGQGCVHTRLNFDLRTKAGIETFRAFLEEASDTVVRHGGSLSGEHGDGHSRAEFLPKMFGPELVQAFREFKGIWDPEGKMNPGRVVDPLRVDERLRLGTGYDPPAFQTHFRFPDDKYSFAQASLRCVGVGKCRKTSSGDGQPQTMCPSYMVTLEEQHTTRGRARLLFEMLQGETIADGWRSEHVKGALDLCLACKGCKGDCPVKVDMATYKAEFLSHYYAGRLRPRTGYAMSLIYWWARLASRLLALVNAITQTPLLGDVAKRAAGIAPQRRLPAFAPTPSRMHSTSADCRDRPIPSGRDSSSGQTPSTTTSSLRSPVRAWTS
ncbi:MAG: FAD-binding and (Fe-S)-binding domain-containing protein [Chloroflexota bacterium]